MSADDDAFAGEWGHDDDQDEFSPMKSSAYALASG